MYLRYDPRLTTVAWNRGLSRAPSVSNFTFLHRNRKAELAFPLSRVATACPYLPTSRPQLLPQRAASASKGGHRSEIQRGGKKKEEKHKNYRISPSGGVLMTSNPGWRCPTFLLCCELLGWAPANIQAAVT